LRAKSAGFPGRGSLSPNSDPSGLGRRPTRAGMPPTRPGNNSPDNYRSVVSIGAARNTSRVVRHTSRITSDHCASVRGRSGFLLGGRRLGRGLRASARTNLVSASTRRRASSSRSSWSILASAIANWSRSSLITAACATVSVPHRSVRLVGRVTRRRQHHQQSHDDTGNTNPSHGPSRFAQFPATSPCV
jgi:hypothetical protein